jgi:uncharacterized protein YcnI
MRSRNIKAAIVVFALFVPVFVQAHVTINPRESTQRATEKYTVRIPTEGEVATTSAELEVPEGVIVESLQVPVGWTYEVKSEDDRIVAITWEVNVKPGEFLEVGFVARNPREGSEIIWILKQHFADGTVSDWTNGPNGIRPTAVTRLAPMTPR